MNLIHQDVIPHGKSPQAALGSAKFCLDNNLSFIFTRTDESEAKSLISFTRGWKMKRFQSGTGNYISVLKYLYIILEALSSTEWGEAEGEREVL